MSTLITIALILPSWKIPLDTLLSSLYAYFPPGSMVQEWQENEDYEEIFEAKCLSCHQNIPLEIKNPQFIEKESSFELQFENSKDQKIWKILFEKREKKYYGMAPLCKKGDLLNIKEISINNCILNVNCPKIDELFNFENEIEKSIQKFEGKECLTSIYTSKPLLEKNYDYPHVIQKNQQVMIYYKTQSGLEIKTQGVAQKKGKKGESIPVIILPQKTKLMAKVISEKEVLYEP